VVAKNGVVQLSGEVGSFGEKWAADRAALRVAGVQALASEIKVNLEGTDWNSDEYIARGAMDSFEWNHLDSRGIKIEVSDGWVTLQGTVQTEHQKEEAARFVRLLGGVKGVVNSIFVIPKGFG
jgi:osmotically-inducible protein OsmY